MKTVVGVFSDATEAQRTIDELLSSGFDLPDISIVASPRMQAGLKFDLKPLDVSDTGRVSARGPLAKTLAQSASRELSSSLRSLGLSSELASHYARAVQRGETLESVVVVDDRADLAVEIMSRHAAFLGDRGAAKPKGERSLAQPAGQVSGQATGQTAVETRQTSSRGYLEKNGDERRIPILKEELQVGKRQVERGHVHVSVRVTESPVSEHIHLREEHVEVERRPLNRPLRADERVLEFKDQDLDIAEYAEEAVVSKDVKIVEEIVVRKRVDERDEVINEKVRNTSVDVGDDRGPGRRNA